MAGLLGFKSVFVVVELRPTRGDGSRKSKQEKVANKEPLLVD
jgi:hypothetical protein